MKIIKFNLFQLKIAINSFRIALGKNSILFFVNFLGVLILSSCQSEAPPLVAPPPAPEVYELPKQFLESGGPIEKSLNPKLSVLFVIDDSQSMKPHQENLAKNISRFANEFGQDKFLDINMGVISIWDSVRYGNAVPELNSKGERNFDPIGRLKLPKFNGVSASEDSPRYINKNTFNDWEQYLQTLKETILIGFKPYCCTKEQIKKGESEPSGPEYEELFSPTIAALTDPRLTEGPNKGFYIPGSHLAVIFVTDADDSTDIMPAPWFYETLLKLTGDPSGSKLSLVGILHPTKYPDSKACPKDPAKTAAKIESVIALNKGKVFNICKDFGEQLTTIGKDIRAKTLKRITIQLDQIPEFGTLSITYKGLPITNITGLTWKYNSRTKSVNIYGLDKVKDIDGTLIKVHYTGVNLNHAQSL